MHWRQTISRITAVLLCADLALACPPACTCKWKNGKQTVECTNKGLLVIPEGIDGGTQVLELSGNNLRALKREEFLRTGLINLQRVYLVQCRITKIENRTFSGLTNLVELDLSENLLETVPKLDCSSLMRLTLSKNPIKVIGNNLLSDLSFLTVLEMSYCDISLVEENAFHGLHSLEWIDLQGNNMSSMRSTKHFPSSLRGIHLQDNPWRCDCELVELHDWLADFSWPHSVEPTCREPKKFSRRVIKTIPRDELACLPNINPTTFYLETEEGKNITLLCKVYSVPEAKISWWFEGELLPNNSNVEEDLKLIYFLEKGTTEKRSELFIQHADFQDNGTFVCIAENAAGSASANFTLRVVLRKNPPKEEEEVPFEIAVAVMSSAALSIVLLLAIILSSVVRCVRQKRRKEEEAKEAAKDERAEEKENTVKLAELQAANQELTRASPSLPVANQLPLAATTLDFYQINQMEPNPDIITDTEPSQRSPVEPAVLLTRGDVFRESALLPNASIIASSPQGEFVCEPVLLRHPRASPLADCGMRDVRLTPVGLLKGFDGGVRGGVFASCYRTLPYNRVVKRQNSAGAGMGRPACRDAEFLNRTSPCPPPFEHHDVRYTAAGYPPHREAAARTASPAGSLSSASTEPCSNSAWPPCASAAGAGGASHQQQQPVLFASSGGRVTI